MSGAHLPLAEKLVRKAREEGIGDKMIVVGGVIPSRDIPKLKEMGVTGVFPGGASFNEIVTFLKEHAKN
jgi:methylmalonyl-CoA mutase C-terminal domain/subunit